MNENGLHESEARNFCWQNESCGDGRLRLSREGEAERLRGIPQIEPSDNKKENR